MESKFEKKRMNTSTALYTYKLHWKQKQPTRNSIQILTRKSLFSQLSANIKTPSDKVSFPTSWINNCISFKQQAKMRMCPNDSKGHHKGLILLLYPIFYSNKLSCMWIWMRNSKVSNVDRLEFLHSRTLRLLKFKTWQTNRTCTKSKPLDL